MSYEYKIPVLPSLRDLYSLAVPFVWDQLLGTYCKVNSDFYNVNSRASEEYKCSETRQKGAFIPLRVWMKWGNSFVFTVGPWLRFCFIGFGYHVITFDWWHKVMIFFHMLALKCCWHSHSTKRKCQDLALSGPAMFPAPVVHLGLVGRARFHFWPTTPKGSHSKQGLPL